MKRYAAIGISLLLLLIGCSTNTGSEQPSIQTPTPPSVEQTNQPQIEYVSKNDSVNPSAASETEENQGAKELQDKQQSIEKAVESQTELTKANFVAATVIGIVDGDTIDVKINGKEERLRLLLVDTPETKDPNEPVQPFGPEATEFAKKTLAGKDVQLEFDGPERDKYDRLLVYLWIGDKIFNQMLLEEGLARIAYVYDPPYTHYDAFVAAEEKAKAEKKGIWSIEGYVTADGFNEEAAAVAEKPKPPTPQQEKVAVLSVYYKNCAEARAAGAAPIYRGEPGYRPALDRDGDGIACE